MIYFINSHSHCRMQATWPVNLALPSFRVRSAPGGHRVLALIPTPGTWLCSVIIPAQRITTIRPSAILSAASHNSSGDQGSTRVNDILHQFPFSLPYSGDVYRADGKVGRQSTRGYFWSAGSDSATNARLLYYNGNYTYPDGSGYKTYGYSVRRAILCSTGLRPNPPLFLKAIKADFTLGGWWANTLRGKKLQFLASKDLRRIRIRLKPS